MPKGRHARNARRQSSKTGLSPGTPVFIGERRMERARIDIIDYGPDHCSELPDATLEQCMERARAETVTWINITGIHDSGMIEAIGRHFSLHPLTIEDIVNTGQRPKAEAFPNYIFIALKMITREEASGTIGVEHVSLVLGDHYVLSFQEADGDVFTPVRERIRTAKGRIRGMKSDYLVYTLMDAIVDHYFLSIEHIGDCIEDIDDRLLAGPSPGDLRAIHRLKRDLLALRKAVWPLRDAIGGLEKGDFPLIQPETRIFLRDLYDHTIQAIDMVETFRDLLAGVHDTYLSTVSNRMNEVMKVLTIISTLFIPLTFIAGVYGMNFEHMPELKWPWGYYAVLAVMGLVAAGMIAFFRRRKWI